MGKLETFLVALELLKERFWGKFVLEKISCLCLRIRNKGVEDKNICCIDVQIPVDLQLLAE